MAIDSYIECGKIINTHGCHGGVKIESWCNTPEVLATLKRVYLRLGEEYREHKIIKASVYKQFVMALISDVDDMDKAISLKGMTVYAARNDYKLSEGEFFIADLIGIDVIDANTGKIYGKVSDFINRGASDIYVIKTENGESMIPAVPEFIDRVDVNIGVFVKPINGMFD